MDCERAEGLLAPYVLGALEPSERSAMDRHADSCAVCTARLREQGEVVAELAYAVPQLEVPTRVKQSLLSGLGQSPSRRRSKHVLQGWWDSLPQIGRRLAAHYATAVALMMVAVMVAGGAWFNTRLNRVTEEKEALAAQLETARNVPESVDVPFSSQLESVAAPAVEAATRVNEERLRVLSHLAAAPGAKGNVLLGTERSANAIGMVVARQPGTDAILTALNLQPLPSDEVYSVWLIRGSRVHRAGEFIVDSTGYGQTVIKLGPPGEYDYILITIQGADRRFERLGVSVMKGDL